MARLLSAVLLTVANAAAALTFTTHFPSYVAADSVYVTSNSSVVYVLWRRTLFRSNDGGNTFTQRNTYDYVDNLIVDPVNPDILYHWNREEVRRSFDGGTSWQPAVFPSPPWMSKLIVDPQHPATLLLSSNCNESAKGGIYRSDDRGDHWTQIVSGQCVPDVSLDPVTGEIYYRTFPEASSADGRIVPSYQVVVDPRTPQVRYGIGFDGQPPQGPYRVVVVTNDDGKNWQRMQLPGVDGTISNLAIDPVSGRLFLATSAGVYIRSSEGGSWSLIAGAPQKDVTVHADSASLYVLSGDLIRGQLFRAPLATLEHFDLRGVVVPNAVYGFAYDSKAHVLYAAGEGVWRSRDSGRHWEAMTGDTRWREAITVDAAGDVYVIVSHFPNQPADVLRYVAATGEWTNAGQVPYANFPAFVAHPTRRGVLFASADFWGDAVAGLYMTDDAGAHWKPIPQISSHVRSVAIHPERPDIVHAATDKGIFISRDGGAQWTQTTAVHPSWITVALSDPSRLYADYGGLIRSDDGGTTWHSLPSPNQGNQAFAVDPLDADSVWLIGESVMHSTDGGRTWRSETSNFSPDLYADLLFIEPDGRHMHVGAAGCNPPYMQPCEWDATLRGVDDGSDGHHRAVHH